MNLTPTTHSGLDGSCLESRTTTYLELPNARGTGVYLGSLFGFNVPFTAIQGLAGLLSDCRRAGGGADGVDVQVETETGNLAPNWIHCGDETAIFDS
jgi:hypothetical protein